MPIPVVNVSPISGPSKSVPGSGEDRDFKVCTLTLWLESFVTNLYCSVHHSSSCVPVLTGPPTTCTSSECFLWSTCTPIPYWTNMQNPEKILPSPTPSAEVARQIWTFYTYPRKKSFLTTSPSSLPVCEKKVSRHLFR